MGPTARRRKRIPQGRRFQLTVRLSEHEHQRLRERAERSGVTMQRLLVEAVLSDGQLTSSERQALTAEFLAARHALASLHHDLRQAGVGRESRVTLGEISLAVQRLVQAVEAIRSSQ